MRRPSFFEHKSKPSRSDSFSALEIHIQPNDEDDGSIIAYDPSSTGLHNSRWSESVHRASIGSAQIIKRMKVPAEFESGVGSTSWGENEVDLGLVESVILEKDSPTIGADIINFHRRPSPPIVASPVVSTHSNISVVSTLTNMQFHRPSASNRIQLNSRTRVLYGSSASSPTTPNTPATPTTRAPIQSFGSYDMLQGQRDHAELRRGSEIFGNTGYEGRALRTGSKSVSKSAGARRVSVAPPKLPELDLHSVSFTSLRLFLFFF